MIWTRMCLTLNTRSIAGWEISGDKSSSKALSKGSSGSHLGVPSPVVAPSHPQNWSC